MLSFIHGRALLLIAIALVAAIAFVTPAKSQQRVNLPVFCMPLEQADNIARKKFKEHPTYRAQGPNDLIYVLYENKQTKSFSLFTISQDGNACAILSGKDWKAFKDGRSDL